MVSTNTNLGRHLAWNAVLVIHVLIKLSLQLIANQVLSQWLVKWHAQVVLQVIVVKILILGQWFVVQDSTQQEVQVSAWFAQRAQVVLTGLRQAHVLKVHILLRVKSFVLSALLVLTAQTLAVLLSVAQQVGIPCLDPLPDVLNARLGMHALMWTESQRSAESVSTKTKMDRLYA
jgi:hypothetical protein